MLATTVILSNDQQGHAAVRFTASDTLLLTDLASPNTSIETVTGLAISSIYWTGDWKLTRNGNTVFQTVVGSFGNWDLYMRGISLGDQSNASIVATTANTASTLILSVSKQATVLAPFV